MGRDTPREMPGGHPIEAQVRPARAVDGVTVFDFCRDTFDWGDYIDEVWEAWLEDPRGQLMVADLEGVPRGVGRASLVSPTEGWLEGVRVHPDFRRQGIADALNAAGRDWLWAQGVLVARLAIAANNLPPQRQVARLGFHEVARFGYWIADARADTTDPTPLAGADDGPRLAATWSASPVRAAVQDLVALGWRWRRLIAEDLRVAATDGAVLRSGDAFALIHDGQDGVRLSWIDGPTSAWVRLVRAARDRAASQGTAHATGLLPELAGIREAMVKAGFTHDASFRVFEIERPSGTL